MADTTYIMKGGKKFQKVEGLYTGWIPTAEQCKEEDLAIHWTGARLPWQRYCEMVSFFRWTLEEFDGEAQARLFYNEATRDMRIVIMPQRAQSGLASSEIADHPGKADIMKELVGYSFCGTIHHHCKAGAFASGTDNEDEIKQPGFHMTIGKLDTKELDLNYRVTFRGFKYETGDVNPFEWIDIPQLDASWPSELRSQCAVYFLKHPQPMAFPEEWKARMVKPLVYQGGTVGGAGTPSGGYQGRGYEAGGTQYGLPFRSEGSSIVGPEVTVLPTRGGAEGCKEKKGKGKRGSLDLQQLRDDVDAICNGNAMTYEDIAENLAWCGELQRTYHLSMAEFEEVMALMIEQREAEEEAKDKAQEAADAAEEAKEATEALNAAEEAAGIGADQDTIEAYRRQHDAVMGFSATDDDYGG